MSEHVVEGLTCLLPVYNQAGALEKAVKAWSNTLERIDRPYEIVVINDGSNDSTKKLLEGSEGNIGLQHRILHLRVIEHAERRGFGASLQSGLAAAQYPLIFYTGCDFAYNPADLKKLLPRLEEDGPFGGQKIDGVVGVRAGIPITGWRKSFGRCWRLLLRVAFGIDANPPPGWLGKKNARYQLLLRALFGLRDSDVDSKFKLFRRKIFERIPLQSTGDFVHAEILAKAHFLTCLIAEELIAERPGPFSAHPEPPSPAPIGKELHRVFFNPDFGKCVVAGG